MRNLRVVVFDVDDTLYLERTYVESGFAAVGAHLDERFGTSDAASLLLAHFERGDRGTIFDTALGELGIRVSPGLIAELVELYRSHHPAIELLPDAVSCLSQLHGVVELGVITDGPIISQQQKIRALGLDELVSLVVVTGELGPHCGKPAHEAFKLVEDTFAVDGPSCAYVADNPTKDFLAPIERGWMAVRVRRRGGLHFEASHVGQLLEFPDLASLPDHLLSDEQ